MSDPLDVTIFDMLAEPFPMEATHWRVGTRPNGGDKGTALAYIDARDVMDRLDGVVGPGNWMDEYEETPKRLLCTISLCLDGRWVAKTDGAGNTTIEGEKGGISDAFKRAAVKWGIGRYLYSLPAPWVSLDTKGRIKESEMEKLNAELSKVAGKQTWGDRNHANMFRALKVAMETIEPENLPNFIDRSEAYLKQLRVGYRREIQNAMNLISSSNGKAA